MCKGLTQHCHHQFVRSAGGQHVLAAPMTQQRRSFWEAVQHLVIRIIFHYAKTRINKGAKSKSAAAAGK